MVRASFKKRIVYQASHFALTTWQSIVFYILFHSLIAYHFPINFIKLSLLVALQVGRAKTREEYIIGNELVLTNSVGINQIC